MSSLQEKISECLKWHNYILCRGKNKGLRECPEQACLSHLESSRKLANRKDTKRVMKNKLEIKRAWVQSPRVDKNMVDVVQNRCSLEGKRQRRKG